MTLDDYERDQQIPCRISGTNRGKAAVAEFVSAMDERFSDPAVLGYDDWRTDDLARKIACAGEMFMKWIAQVPPFGTAVSLPRVVTVAGDLFDRRPWWVITNCITGDAAASRAMRFTLERVIHEIAGTLMRIEIEDIEAEAPKE